MVNIAGKDRWQESLGRTNHWQDNSSIPSIDVAHKISFCPCTYWLGLASGPQQQSSPAVLQQSLPVILASNPRQRSSQAALTSSPQQRSSSVILASDLLQQSSRAVLANSPCQWSSPVVLARSPHHWYVPAVLASNSTSNPH